MRLATKVRWLIGILAMAGWQGHAQTTKEMKENFKIEVVAGFPNTESGIEKGVSAPFAGAIGKHLIVAGGCNFPEKPVAEGGKKRFYKGIYAALTSQESRLTWQKIGELPAEAAYGVTIGSADTLYIIGGSNAEGRLCSTYALSLDAQGTSVRLRELPSLPFALDNMAGALVGNQLLLVGGLRDEEPSLGVLSLDLQHVEEGWKWLLSLPGMPRVQPVCAAINGKLCLWGGFYDGSKGGNAVVHTDGLSYDPLSETWQQLSDLGADANHSRTATGGSVAQISPTEVLFAGGVDKELFFDAISGAYLKVAKENYLRQPVEWYRFNPQLFLYDADTDSWTATSLSSPHLARAGAAMVFCNGAVYYIGGELKPGIRSPQVSRITFTKD